MWKRGLNPRLERALPAVLLLDRLIPLESDRVSPVDEDEDLDWLDDDCALSSTGLAFRRSFFSAIAFGSILDEDRRDVWRVIAVRSSEIVDGCRSLVGMEACGNSWSAAANLRD